jgi:hypothetical protein
MHFFIRPSFHNQNFGFHWNQMCNNLIKFDKPRRLLKQVHKKVANNFSFGSTHILNHVTQSICNNLGYSPNL